jgi:hypothetical protein
LQFQAPIPRKRTSPVFPKLVEPRLCLNKGLDLADARGPMPMNFKPQLATLGVKNVTRPILVEK